MAPLPTQHKRVKEAPQISANDLARYMVATESGKIGIIRRARESGTAGRIRYTDVKDVLRNAMADAPNERRLIAGGFELFEQRASDGAISAYMRDDAEKSIDALNAFVAFRNELAGFDYQLAPKKQPYLMMAGVKVSVNVDLLIHKPGKAADEIGGVLFRMTMPDEEETSAAAAKRREMGMFAATLVQMQIRQNLSGNRSPNHKLCWSVDVQCKERHVAAKDYAQRASNLENACRFISAMWGSA